MTVKTLIKVSGQTVDAASVTVPANRKFRDAWQLDGDVIEVDLDAARDIVRKKLRQDRRAKFDNLDRVIFPLSRKVIRGQALTASQAAAFDVAEGKAQKLRDAPAHPSIAAAATVADLDAITLDTVTA